MKVSLRWMPCYLLLAVSVLGVVIMLQPNVLGNDINYESERLDIEIFFSNSKFSINDSVAFDIKLINKGKEKLTVANRLELGHFTGLLLIIKDETGGLMPSEIYYYLPPPPLSTSLYISLLPDHYFGATLRDTAVNLFVKPGKYYVSAIYNGPVHESFAKESVGIENLWGKERTPISSPGVWIEVTED